MSSVELRVRAEIVRVVRNVQAADTEFQSHPFVQHESSVLARGYYVIVWSGNLDDTRFNESARFYGPYDLALMAKLKIREHVAAHQGFDSSPKMNQPSSSSVSGLEPVSVVKRGGEQYEEVNMTFNINAGTDGAFEPRPSFAVAL